MKNAQHRRSALLVAAVAGAAVLSPLGAVAHASGGTQTLYYVASKSGAPAALYTAAGVRVSPAGTEVRDLRASQDGTRFVDLEFALDADGNQVQSVVVYDISGHPLKVVTRVPVSVAQLTGPALSPDGSTAVWTRHDHGGGPTTLFSKSLTTDAAPVPIGSDLFNALFATPNTLIVRHFDGTGYWMPASGGTPTLITPFPWQAVGMTVSPDGSKVAWEHELMTTPATANLAVANLGIGNDGSVSIGDPTWVATGEDNYAPAFTRDGTHVLFIKADNGATGSGQVMQAPVDASSAPVVVNGSALGNVITQAVGEIPAAPVTPLVQTTALSAVLGGSAATLRWTNPGDSRVSQVLVKRFLGSTQQKQVYVPLPATSYRDTGLVIGKTYTYTFTSVDRAGHVAAAPPSWSLTAAGAAPSVADPTSLSVTRGPFPVRFGQALTNVFWTVDYRVNSGSTWTRWVSGKAGSARTFGSPSSPGVAATTSVTGQTYQFRVRAFDAHGNSTPVVDSSRTVVPLDQSRAGLTGGTTVSDTRAWFGSYRRMSTLAQYARITVYGNRLQVIAWRCSGCGSFAVYDNGLRIATVSTYRSSTLARAVLFTKLYPSNATHTFTIRSLGTPGHSAVLLDGIAMRR